MSILFNIYCRCINITLGQQQSPHVPHLLLQSQSNANLDPMLSANAWLYVTRNRRTLDAVKKGIIRPAVDLAGDPAAASTPTVDVLPITAPKKKAVNLLLGIATPSRHQRSLRPKHLPRQHKAHPYHLRLLKLQRTHDAARMERARPVSTRAGETAVASTLTAGATSIIVVKAARGRLENVTTNPRLSNLRLQS